MSARDVMVDKIEEFSASTKFIGPQRRQTLIYMMNAMIRDIYDPALDAGDT